MYVILLSRKFHLGDDSWLFRPTLAVNLADNLSLELFWTRPAGQEPEVSGTLAPAVVRSEFGNQGESVGFFMKLFF